jgi:hypothetical protein
MGTSGHRDMETWRNGDMETWRHEDMETRRHGGHGYMDMETWRLETGNGNRKPRWFTMIRLPFANHAKGILSFVRLLMYKQTALSVCKRTKQTKPTKRTFPSMLTWADGKRSGVSGPIRSVKIYSCAQCTMQKKSVCCRDVPCLAHMEQGPGPSTLSTHHPPYLPGYWGLSLLVALNKDGPGQWMDTCKLPNPEPVVLENVCWYCSLFPSSNTVFGMPIKW